MKNITLPLTNEDIAGLNEGDTVFLSGTLYTARDNTHMKLIKLLDAGEKTPFELDNASIYYMGPTPAPVGFVCGSAGPTTSARMDKFTPRLLSEGVKVMIGKGNRSEEVKQSIKDNDAVYFGTIGGAGAYLADKIKKMDCVAFPELGPEAVYKLYVVDFPVVVLNK